METLPLFCFSFALCGNDAVTYIASQLSNGYLSFAREMT
jgi:hypothetical protein